MAWCQFTHSTNSYLLNLFQEIVKRLNLCDRTSLLIRLRAKLSSIMLNMIEVKGLLEFLFKIEIIELLKIIPLISISFFFILSAELFILYTYLYWEYAQPSIQSIINPTQLFFNSKFLQFQQFHPSITLDNAPRILNEIHFLNWNLRKPVLLLENLFSNRRH